MAHDRAPGGEVVLFDSAPLAQYSLGSLLSANPYLVAAGSERVSLIGDIVVGNYGVAGALFLDSRPEQRWDSYRYNAESDHATYPSSLAEVQADNRKWGGMYSHLLDGEGKVRDPEAFAHYVGTASGLKMVRAFWTPAELVSQLGKLGKHIGPALLQECFNAEDVSGDIPDEGKMEVWPEQGYLDEEASPKDFGPIFERKVKAITDMLQMGLVTDNYYVSFHGWPWSTKILAAGQSSLYRAISKLDGLIANFDRRKSVPTLELGDLANVETRVIAVPDLVLGRMTE